MQKFWPLLATLLFIGNTTIAQNQVIVEGRIKNAITGEPIKMAIIFLDSNSVTADSLGYFFILGKSPGFTTIKATAIGFESATSPEFLATYEKRSFITLELQPLRTENNVNIERSSIQQRKPESPLSVQNLSLREIERNPGGNRDISKIVQSLPGVISIPGFRNDIIIRGGAPSENKFYLDGIEIPVINHFQAQGGTGGPVGLLNVNFIKEVNLFTGAYPVNISNGLSGVFDFKQIDGASDKLSTRLTLGSSDAGITLTGPLGKKKKTTFIFSARQSYLQFLFSALKLPFLPNYFDYQGKIKTQLSPDKELSIVIVGAVDFFRLNEKVNEQLTDSAQIKTNQYILNGVPDFSQWNYAIGAVYTHFQKSGKMQIFLSRNMLNNAFVKYRNNDESQPLIRDYQSRESEYKTRLEKSFSKWGINFTSGIGIEWLRYQTNYIDKGTPFPIDFDVLFSFGRYSLFQKAIKRFKGNAGIVSMGLRMDAALLNSETKNPFNQSAFSLSYSKPLAKKMFLNFNIGRFFQLPATTIIGFKNINNQFENKSRVRYTEVRQIALGLQYNQGTDTKFTLEGFYKNYYRYPFSITNQISLANLGADFNVVGNEPVSFLNKGRAYGMEFLIQKRSKKGLYGIASYTLAWSEFQNTNGIFLPSSWDSRHTISLTGGIKLKKNWEIGLKWRFVTGRPYTPIDTLASMNKNYWDNNGIAKLNFNRINSLRFSNFSQVDFRIDKVWYRKKYSFNLYFDIQNVLNQVQVLPNTLYVQTTSKGEPISDPNNNNLYLPDFLENTNGFLQPSIGLILDF